MIDFHFAITAVGSSSTAFPVLAYLDPGMGSFALQILLASLFGGLFAWKQAWSGLKVRFAAILGDRQVRASTENARPGIHGQSTVEIL